MNFKVRALLFVFIILSQLCVAQQNKFQWKEASKDGFTYRYVTNDPSNARYYTLKNGLTVILSPIKKDPRIQSYIAVKAGSKTDPATNTGLAHYLEHMVFKGTDKYGTLNWEKEKPELEKIEKFYELYNKTADETLRKNIYHQIDSISGVASRYSIANEYDKMMSAMGAQGTNAFTSFEQTVYTDDVPSSSVDKYLAVQAERFRNPQMRIFHTELEAVYEEKNRGLDTDSRKVFEKLFAELFKNHNYGLQTTIGTVEHLKNPSLVEIRKYYNTYYVPNNMAVIMSGDFDPDIMIRKISNAFSYMQRKEIPAYTFKQEMAINEPVLTEVTGPDAESVTIGFRLPGNKDKDIIMADLLGQILTNGKAGLMDLNLVKKQKLLRASAFAYTLIDYGVLYMTGAATQGQSLEEVQSLMLGEIENIRKGKFDDALITSIINNQKKSAILATETYSSRASYLMDAFTNELDWKSEVAYVERLSAITKKDIVEFANKYFSDNYVAVFKRKGEDKNVIKVEKPQITPVQTNPKEQSAFVKTINSLPVNSVKPVWVDYNKDMKKSKVGPAELLYVQNKENSIFRMRYRYDVGTWNSKLLPIAAQYLQFIGTKNLSSEEVSKEFYKIACSFNITTSNEYTTVTIEGLQENFTKAVKLFEDLIRNGQPDDKALISLKARLTKTRNDAKANKGAIMNGLTSYARYGSHNPFNSVLSNDQLKNITATELTNALQSLNDYSHKIIYYGPAPIESLTTTLNSLHRINKSFIKVPPKTAFIPVVMQKNEVLFADYNMVQAETRWIRNGSKYDAGNEALISMYNNYLGDLVFQTIRESKALAYSTFSYYAVPEKKEDNYFTLAYVGSQSDKFSEAVKGMNELLNELPEVESNIINSRAGLKKDIETQRIVQDGIIFNYLDALQKGHTSDIRKQKYNAIEGIGYKEMADFHRKNIAGLPYTYIIVASEKRINPDDMKLLGEVKKLQLEEIFGY